MQVHESMRPRRSRGPGVAVAGHFVISSARTAYDEGFCLTCHLILASPTDLRPVDQAG